MIYLYLSIRLRMIGSCGWMLYHKERAELHPDVSVVNCIPLSEVKTAGTPKCVIQWWSRAFTESLVFLAERGMASAHLVDRSMTGKRCVYPFDEGSEPTRSIWLWENRSLGIGIGWISALVCLWTLPLWHPVQSLHHNFTSDLMFFLTNLYRYHPPCSSDSRVVYLMQGGKISFLKVSGTRGCGIPVETSHKSWTFCTGSKTILRVVGRRGG